MIAHEHPEVIEGRQWLTETDVIDSEEAAQYGSTDKDCDYSDKEDESGLVDAGVSTGVTEVETKCVE